jgi:ribose transport system ATP-binding protein
MSVQRQREVYFLPLADLSSGERTVLLEAHNVSKAFGATRALQEVSIGLEAGRVHALVGENGAGKSTLFKICAGALEPDSGEMLLDGRPYKPRNLHDAQDKGVALVFQELTINPALSIAENIFIDRMRHFALPGVGLTNWRQLRNSAQGLLDSIGAGISVNQNLTELDLGQLKIIEVARALSYNPKVLFLDESTAFLNTQEIHALFDVIANLRKQGIAIGYISHHLEEVDEIADTITILKDGTWVGDFAADELTSTEIEARMVGREIGHSIYQKNSKNISKDEVLFQMANITVPGRLTAIGVDLCRGEILGIAGLKGSGGEVILSVINGDQRYREGHMRLDGREYRPHTPADAWARGVAYMPGDRAREGLITDFSVRVNLSMAAIPRRGPFVDRGTETQLVGKLMPMLRIKAASSEVPCHSLSGGNLQKVVLGKCLAPSPRLLLLNNPTRGIDVGARMEIYGVIRDLASQGIAIVLVSEDLAELIGMSDRIIVMRKGVISREFSYDERPNEETIIRYMI